MESMSNCDFYEVNFGSVLSDSDRKVLIDLYQPIVGALSLALFFKMWSDAQTDHEEGFYSFDKLMSSMQASSDVILNSRKHLEALGLMKTYAKEVSKDKKCYLFVLYAPRQPKEFFEDPFFNGLLSKYVGKKEVQKIANFYKIKVDINNYVDITATFGEVFKHEINTLNSSSISVVPNLKGKASGTIYTPFDVAKFINIVCREHQVNEDFISKTDLNHIAKIASIYGINEESTSSYLEYFCDFTSSKKDRINYEKMTKTFKNLNEYSKVMPKKINKSIKTKEVSSDGKYKELIKLMEITPAAKYMSYLQNNTSPSQADLELIENLATNFKLSNGIINALISYVLEVKNNTLPRKYVEKVASSLLREGVSNVLDTLNYLNKVNKNNKKIVTDKPVGQKKNKYFDDDDKIVEFDPTLEDEEDE